MLHWIDADAVALFVTYMYIIWERRTVNIEHKCISNKIVECVQCLSLVYSSLAQKYDEEEEEKKQHLFPLRLFACFRYVRHIGHFPLILIRELVYCWCKELELWLYHASLFLFIFHLMHAIFTIHLFRIQ